MRNILYFCSKFNVFMEKCTPFAGLFLIILGTIGLVLTRFGSLSDSNSLLLTSLVLIVGGIVLHIRLIKRQSNY